MTLDEAVGVGFFTKVALATFVVLCLLGLTTAFAVLFLVVAVFLEIFLALAKVLVLGVFLLPKVFGFGLLGICTLSVDTLFSQITTPVLQLRLAKEWPLANLLKSPFCRNLLH